MFPSLNLSAAKPTLQPTEIIWPQVREDSRTSGVTSYYLSVDSSGLVREIPPSSEVFCKNCVTHLVDVHRNFLFLTSKATPSYAYLAHGFLFVPPYEPTKFGS